MEKYFRGKQGLDCYLKIMEGSELRRTSEYRGQQLGSADSRGSYCDVSRGSNGLSPHGLCTHRLIIGLATTKSPRESIEKGIEMAQKALALDDTICRGPRLLCHLYTQKREYDKAIAEGERAVALNPSGATVIANYAMSLDFAGRSEEAIPLFQKAIRLNPFGPMFYYHQLRQRPPDDGAV